ncbi:MAG: hypothetical protein AB1553_10020 [Nitrospirota bacterium]
MIQNRTQSTERRNPARRAKVLLSFALILSFMFTVSIPAGAVETKAPALQFSKNPQIQQIKPKKPVRIKLHRTAKGEYQWDITGDNADDIVRADERLRKLLIKPEVRSEK